MTDLRIKRGSWSFGRRLPAQDSFPVRLLDSFIWGVYDKYGKPVYECTGVRIEVEGHQIRMDRSVFEELTL